MTPQTWMKIDEPKIIKCIKSNNVFTEGKMYSYRIRYPNTKEVLYCVISDHIGGYIRLHRDIFEYYFDIIKCERKEKLAKLMK